MSLKNIDDLVVKTQQEQISGEKTDPQPIEIKHEEPAQDVLHGTSENNEPQAEVKEKIEETEAKPVVEKSEVKEESPIDEYGNPTAKPRMYSEEEVQNMIRDRLSRGRHAENQQTTQQQVKQATDEFKADPASEESWEVQLEKFIDKTIEKRQAKLSQSQWEKEQALKQVEFETKFTSGMNKYNDFHEVVAGKPITDSMMLATRHLENPAAFVYGAAKMHPQELDRISKIADPYIQAAELGRLHEKMVKQRNISSQAAKPIEAVKGDLPAKALNDQPSLESRIHEYGKKKLNRR